MTQYIATNSATNEVLYGVGLPDAADFTGPPAPEPDPADGVTFYPWQGQLSFSGAPTPTSAYQWQSGAPAWVETATLDELKSAKNAEINSARMSANLTSFTYLGKQIACDTLSRSDIDGTNGYVSIFNNFPDNWAGGWKATDNTYVPIATVDDWKAFYKAMVDQGNANFHHSQDLKSQLASATTPEQVAAIVW